MNKKLLLATVSAFLLFFLCFFVSDKVAEAKDIKRYFEITEHLYEKTESVFKNKFKNVRNESYPKVKINVFESFWLVEGKRYTVQKNSYSIYDPTVNWQVDLSQLLPCGVYDDITIYSSTGEFDNGVLVAEEKEKLVLLVSDDTLSPYKYSYKDFVVESTEKMTNTLFEAIWSDHLSGEYDISYLAIDDASGLKHIKIQSKEHPELIYSIHYYDYKGKYYSKLPFDEDSNGYYDISQRIKEGKKIMKRTNHGE